MATLIICVTSETSAAEILKNITVTGDTSLDSAKKIITALDDEIIECSGSDKYTHCLINKKSNDKQAGYLVACHGKVNSIMQVISTDSDFLDFLEHYIKIYGNPSLSIESGGGPSTILPKFREIVYTWKGNNETIKLTQRPLEYNHDGSPGLQKSLTARIYNQDLWKSTCWK